MRKLEYKNIVDELKSGDKVTVKKTGDKFIFGRAEYSANWMCSVWDIGGEYMGCFNFGWLLVSGDV